MRKGTTPTFTFELPFSTDLLTKARVIFEKGDTQLPKELNTASFDGNTIKVRLTQEETFLFPCNSQIKVQLRVLTKNGEALASDPFIIFVEECLDNEVLT